MTKTFKCSMCNETFNWDGPMPTATEEDMIVCTACNTRIQAVLASMGASQTSLQ